jgi:hypothetical protein
MKRMTWTLGVTLLMETVCRFTLQLQRGGATLTKNVLIEDLLPPW